VLQSDGGARAACFNATVLALADAGVAMRDLLATCSAGYLEGTPLLDLNYLEEGGGGPDMCVGYHPATDKVALMQMDNKLTVESLEQVIELSTHGCKVVAGFMRTTILEHTQQMAAARGPVRL
jgi:exosome complex component RRP41